MSSSSNATETSVSADSAKKSGASGSSGPKSGSQSEDQIDQKTKFELARKAHLKGDVEATRAAHANAKHTEEHKSAGEYVKAMVFGGLDGICTTFAVVAGVTGANLSVGVVLVLGFANLFADGLSMGLGEYVSGRAEIEFIKGERAREEWEFENVPEDEKQEMVDLYVEKGLEREDAVIVIDILSKKKDFFVDQMLNDELGLAVADIDGSPFKQGLAMFFAFVVFGAVPLLAFIVARGVQGAGKSTRDPFIASCLMTAAAMFVLGCLKSRFESGGTKITQLLWGGCVMLFTGAFSSGVAYAIGVILEFLIKDDKAKCG